MSKDSSYLDDANMEEIQRIDEINESILFNGELQIKVFSPESVDSSSYLTPKFLNWSKRYAVIRSGEKIVHLFG